MSQRYRAFGLTFASDLEFPELPVGEGTPDVTVRFGSVPAHLDGAVATGVLFEAKQDDYLLRVPSTARYRARNGSEVTVDPVAGANSVDIRALFLGSVVTAVLHQRGSLVLHASAVAGSDGAIVLAGNSGQGKSTLLAALAQQGWEVLADDVTAVSEDPSGALIVQPGFPVARLWRDAAVRLGHGDAGLAKALTGVEKYLLPLENQFCRVPRVLRRVFVLSVSNQADVNCDRVPLTACFETVRRQTRNLRALAGAQTLATHFRLATRVAASIPLYRLDRPRDVDSIDQMIERLYSVV